MLISSPEVKVIKAIFICTHTHWNLFFPHRRSNTFYVMPLQVHILSVHYSQPTALWCQTLCNCCLVTAVGPKEDWYPSLWLWLCSWLIARLFLDSQYSAGLKAGMAPPFSSWTITTDCCRVCGRRVCILTSSKLSWIIVKSPHVDYYSGAISF